MATRDNPGATSPRGTPDTTTPREDITVPEQQTRASAVHDELRGTAAGPASWRDRVRWGAIWAGTLVVLPVFIVLQLLFFAFGVLGPAGAADTAVTRSIVSGVLALVAFFVGGLLAGASTMWRGAPDGLLHGVLVWALSVLGILSLGLIGGSALLGPLAEGGMPDMAPGQALAMGRQIAGWTALSLGLSVVAAALGGTIGAKMWPGREQQTRTR